MESGLGQDRSIQANVRPANRLLRFGLASIAALVLGGFILGVSRATGMLVGGADAFFFPLYLGQLVQFAPVVGIAAAAYPRRWLSSRHNAFIVTVVGAAVGAAVGVLCYYLAPVADSVDSLFNRYTVHSVVGPLFVLDSHACLRISNGIVLDRYRRVSYAGDIDPQNANRLIAAAVLCVLAVVLPAPAFNFAKHNQELTVAFVIPANPGTIASKPPRIGYSGGGCLNYAGTDAVEAHVLDAVRKAGLPDPYRVANVARCGNREEGTSDYCFESSYPRRSAATATGRYGVDLCFRPGWLAHNPRASSNARPQC